MKNDRADVPSMDDALVDEDLLAADESALGALFDATALTASEAALARLAAFAGDVPVGDAVSAQAAVAETTTRRPAPSSMPQPAEVWPVRSLLALAAALLLTMGGLSWSGEEPSGIHARPGGVVDAGHLPSLQAAHGRAAARSSADSLTATTAWAAEDPLMRVGQSAWIETMADEPDFDLGAISLDEEDEDEWPSI